MGPDRRFGSFGLCFGPNRRFSTHFELNLMFWDLTELWPMWPICPDGTRRALTEDSTDPYRCMTEIRVPDEPRRGLTDDSMDPYWCTTKIRTHTGPRRAPTSLDGTQRDPT